MLTPHDANSEGGEAGSTLPSVTLGGFVSRAQLKQRLLHCAQSPSPYSDPPPGPMMGAVKHPTLPLISNP